MGRGPGFRWTAGFERKRRPGGRSRFNAMPLRHDRLVRSDTRTDHEIPSRRARRTSPRRHRMRGHVDSGAIANAITCRASRPTSTRSRLRDSAGASTDGAGTRKLAEEPRGAFSAAEIRSRVGLPLVIGLVGRVRQVFGASRGKGRGRERLRDGAVPRSTSIPLAGLTGPLGQGGLCGCPNRDFSRSASVGAKEKGSFGRDARLSLFRREEGRKISPMPVGTSLTGGCRPWSGKRCAGGSAPGHLFSRALRSVCVHVGEEPRRVGFRVEIGSLHVSITTRLDPRHFETYPSASASLREAAGASRKRVVG